MLLLSVLTLVLDLVEDLFGLGGQLRELLRKLVQTLVFFFYFVQKYLVIMLCHQDLFQLLDVLLLCVLDR